MNKEFWEFNIDPFSITGIVITEDTGDYYSCDAVGKNIRGRFWLLIVVIVVVVSGLGFVGYQHRQEVLAQQQQERQVHGQLAEIAADHKSAKAQRIISA